MIDESIIEIMENMRNIVESEASMQRTEELRKLIQELEVSNKFFIEAYPKAKIKFWNKITRIFNQWYKDYQTREDIKPTLKNDNLEDYFYELLMYPQKILSAFIDECSKQWRNESSEYWIDGSYNKFADMFINGIRRQILMNQLIIFKRVMLQRQRRVFSKYYNQ